MSILVKEDYANPDIPLWAKNGSGGGGGVIPQLLNSMTAENSYNMSDYNTDDVITPLGASINQPVSGNVMVYVNMNIFSNGIDLAIPLQITKNGDSWYSTQAYANINSPVTNWNFNISIPYVANVTDEYYYNIIVNAPENVQVYTSCSFVFYPNPV